MSTTKAPTNPKLVPFYTFAEHPNPSAVFDWVRNNWHWLSEEVAQDYVEALKAFAKWHGVTVDYSISACPDRGEFIRFSSEPNYSHKPDNWEECPLTGSTVEHTLWEATCHDELQSFLDELHAENDYIYSDEGLTDFLVNNEYRWRTIMTTDELEVLNAEDRAFYEKCFRVTIGYYRSINFAVYADCEQDALDKVIDWAVSVEDSCEGWFISEEELDSSDTLDNYISGGNEGRVLSFGTEELQIEELTFYSEWVKYSTPNPADAIS